MMQNLFDTIKAIGLFLALFVCLALFFLGCAAHEPKRFTPRHDLTPQERALILQHLLQQGQIQPMPFGYGWGQPYGPFYQPPLKLDPPFQYGPMLPPTGFDQPRR